MGKRTKLGMSVCPSETRIILVCIRSLTSKWLERSRIWLTKWKKLMKLVDLPDPTSFLDYENLRRTQRENIFLTSTEKCSNHEFLLGQLKHCQGGRKPHAKAVGWSSELAEKKTEQWSVNKLTRAVRKRTRARDKRLARLILIHSSHKSSPTILSFVKHGSALSIGFIFGS